MSKSVEIFNSNDIFLLKNDIQEFLKKSSLLEDQLKSFLENKYPELMKKALKLDNWYESLIDLIFNSPNVDEEWERLSDEEQNQFISFLESDTQGQVISFDEFREKIKNKE